MPSPTDPPVEIERCRSISTGATWHNITVPMYCPSIFLLGALIFWTGISATVEVIVPFDAFLFSITTYAPALHFSAQLIVRRTVGSGQDLDALELSNRARLLMISWILNMGVHVGLWWVCRHTPFAGVFLIPILPGSQATLVMIFIVIRYTVDIYMTKREQRLGIAQDDEEAASVENETAVLIQPVDPATTDENVPPWQEASDPAAETIMSTSASPSAIPLYRPSILLLLVSIILFFCTLILDIQDYSKQPTLHLAIISSILTYIPTILLYRYIILQILRKNTMESLQHSTTVSGLSFDLIPLWLVTRVLMAFALYSHSESRDRVAGIPVSVIFGGVEVFPAAYFAVRYTRSVHAERRHRIRMNLVDDDLNGPVGNIEVPSSVNQPTTDLFGEIPRTFYHPSPVLLLISTVLSTACLIIECLAQPVCGAPMSAIVYVPTIIVHLHLIYQQYRRPNPSSNSAAPIQEFNKSRERSMQLCLIWLLTQAFYVFVWPFGQYSPKVMNPWVRSSEVVLLIYIAVRYVGDQKLRNSGVIRLPPDNEDGDTTRTESPSSQ